MFSDSLQPDGFGVLGCIFAKTIQEELFVGVLTISISCFILERICSLHFVFLGLLLVTSPKHETYEVLSQYNLNGICLAIFPPVIELIHHRCHCPNPFLDLEYLKPGQMFNF